MEMGYCGDGVEGDPISAYSSSLLIFSPCLCFWDNYYAGHDGLGLALQSARPSMLIFHLFLCLDGVMKSRELQNLRLCGCFHRCKLAVLCWIYFTHQIITGEIIKGRQYTVYLGNEAAARDFTVEGVLLFDGKGKPIKSLTFPLQLNTWNCIFGISGNHWLFQEKKC